MYNYRDFRSGATLHVYGHRSFLDPESKVFFSLVVNQRRLVSGHGLPCTMIERLINAWNWR